jgi:CRISPR-associated endoribonuclease Cas6
MLISFLLNLTPERDATAREHLGRACYAEVLYTMERRDPDLAHAIHDRKGHKPLTCSGLIGGVQQPNGIRLRQGEACAVRITALNEPTAACLAAVFWQSRPSSLALQGIPFAVTGVTCDEKVDAWTGQTSYEALAAPLFSPTPPPQQVTLEFVTPTSFRRKEMNMPFPLPELVFGSLADKWNFFANTVLSDDLRRFAEEKVAVSRLRLDSYAVEQKNAALHMGSIGRVTYAITGGDRYWQAAVEVLAGFALYSGVGVKTTTGMGQVRRIG